MRKYVILLLIGGFLAGCAPMEIGKLSPEKQRLYDHNNDEAYCEENPEMCVNGVPWS